MSFQQIMNTLANKYLVQDINTKEAKLIFILESPHVQELKHGVPVAGGSGATMTRNLFNDTNEPLGKLLKSHTLHGEDHKGIGQIGLMNVCQIPMQRSAYQKGDIAELNGFFTILEGIRTSNHKTNYKDEEWNILQGIIIEDFQNRLQLIKGDNHILVPCGRFAQKFLKLALQNSSFEEMLIMDDVPHPSYNSWSREKYQPLVSKVKQALFS